MQLDKFLGKISVEDDDDDDEKRIQQLTTKNNNLFIVLSFLQVKSLPGVNNDDVGSLRSSDWTHREMCPVIKWLDDIKVPYVYSAWENYYRSNDTMWYISQHGHVRSYRISKRYTY